MLFNHKLVVPQEVYWIQWQTVYQRIWRTSLLVSIRKENCNTIDNVIYNKVTNCRIKQNVENLLQHLKVLLVANDRTQEKNCTIAATVNIWEVLEKDLIEVKLVKTCMEIFSDSYNQALGSPHFLDYLMNPHCAGIDLNASEKNRIFIICKRKIFSICHAYYYETYDKIKIFSWINF